MVASEFRFRVNIRVTVNGECAKLMLRAFTKAAKSTSKMVLATSSSFSAEILRQSQSERVLFTGRHSRIVVRWKEGRWGTSDTAADLKRGCARLRRGKTKNLQQQQYGYDQRPSRR